MFTVRRASVLAADSGKRGATTELVVSTVEGNGECEGVVL